MAQGLLVDVPHLAREIELARDRAEGVDVAPRLGRRPHGPARVMEDAVAVAAEDVGLLDESSGGQHDVGELGRLGEEELVHDEEEIVSREARADAARVRHGHGRVVAPHERSSETPGLELATELDVPDRLRGRARRTEVGPLDHTGRETEMFGALVVQAIRGSEHRGEGAHGAHASSAVAPARETDARLHERSLRTRERESELANRFRRETRDGSRSGELVARAHVALEFFRSRALAPEVFAVRSTALVRQAREREREHRIGSG